MRDTDPRIHKQATDSFFRSDLADLLAARAVDTVVITGLATDYCVDATARSALSHGLNVILVSDGHTPAADGIPPRDHNAHGELDEHIDYIFVERVGLRIPRTAFCPDNASDHCYTAGEWHL